MSIIIPVGNQYLSVVWKILKILNILIRTLYMMLFPLILVKIILVTKVTNILLKGVTSKTTIHSFRCMLKFQNINSKV